jgi:hypothetical protein
MPRSASAAEPAQPNRAQPLDTRFMPLGEAWLRITFRDADGLRVPRQN